MRQIGELTNKDTNDKLIVIYDHNKLDYQRLDILSTADGYNPMFTDDCVASLIIDKKGSKYLGDGELLKSVLRLKEVVNQVEMVSKRDMKIENGEVIITSDKENQKLGLKYNLVQKQGYISYERYESPEFILEFTSNNQSRGDTLIQPINIQDYISNNVGSNVGLIDEAVEFHSLDYLKQTYDIAHIEEEDFVVVENIVQAEARLKEFVEAPTKFRAFDLETTGTDMGMYGEDLITGIVLSYDIHNSTYFPFRQDKCTNLPIWYIQVILDAVDSLPSDVMNLAHNGKFEIQGIWKEYPPYAKNSPYYNKYKGITDNFEIPEELKSKFNQEYIDKALTKPNVRIDGDTMILSTLVNPGMSKTEKGKHSLKHLTYKYERKFYLELDQIFTGPIKFNVLTPDIIKYYACPDGPNTIKVFNGLIEELPKDEYGVFFKIENPLLYVTAENEFYGLPINKERLVSALENERYKVNITSEYFKRWHHISGNINSPQTKKMIFYDKLKCPVEVRTNKGQPSTSKNALERILEIGQLREYNEALVPKSILDLNGDEVVKGVDMARNKYPSLVILDRFNKATKELGALNRMQNHSEKDRVMFYINQNGAASGRRTSDAQQYSDTMKSMVSADSRDHWFWSCDWKQVELRVLAYLAGQKDLIEMESDPDIDVHRAILSIISGKPVWAISAKERKKGKSTNFGVVYMMSAIGLARKDKGPKATDADIAEAQASINGFYDGLPYIKCFKNENETKLRENGYVVTNFNRYRYFKEILDPTTPQRKVNSAIRAGNNTYVQGFAADMLKIVESKVRKYIRDHGWDEKVECDGVMLPKVRMMLSIHDEILLSSHKSIPIEEIIKMFKICMEIEIPEAPPFFAAPAMVNYWSDGKNDAFEIDLRFRDQILEAWEDGHRTILHTDTYIPCTEYKRKKAIKVLVDRLRRTVFGDKIKAASEEDIYNCMKEIDKSDCWNDILESYLSDLERSDSLAAKKLAVGRLLDPDWSAYLTDLNNFRSSRLRDYMDDLIRKYKTPEAVAEHVRHPELTHTLISVEIKKNEKFDHEDAIKESVIRYMANREKSDDDSLIIQYDDEPEGVNTFEELEEYFDVDEDGVVHAEEAEEDEDEYFVNDEIYENSTKKIARTRVIYMYDKVLIDMSGININKEGELIHEEIVKLCGEGKYYRVVYLINGELRQAPEFMHMDFVPEEELDKMIEGVLNNGRNIGTA